MCSLVPSLLDLLVGTLPLPAATMSAAQRRSSGARASPARASPAPEVAEAWSYLADLRAAGASRGLHWLLSCRSVLGISLAVV